MNWAIMALAFGLLFVLRNRSKPKWLWAVNAALAAIGGAAMAQTAVGDWIGSLLSTVAGWVGGLVSVGAGIVLGIGMLVLTLAVALDIGADRRADTLAIVGLLLLPVLFGLASGPVADGGLALVGSIREAGTSLLSPLIGA